MKIGDFWGPECSILAKTGPKVSRVDLKKANKRADLCYKTFFRMVSHGATMCHNIAYYHRFHMGYAPTWWFLVVLLGIHFCTAYEAHVGLFG